MGWPFVFPGFLRYSRSRLSCSRFSLLTHKKRLYVFVFIWKIFLYVSLFIWCFITVLSGNNNSTRYNRWGKRYCNRPILLCDLQCEVGAILYFFLSENNIKSTLLISKLFQCRKANRYSLIWCTYYQGVYV